MIFAILAAAVLAGCGGSSDSDTTVVQTPVVQEQPTKMGPPTLTVVPAPVANPPTPVTIIDEPVHPHPVHPIHPAHPEQSNKYKEKSR